MGTGAGRFPGKVLLDGVVHLPLVLPPVVTGWLLLLTFGGQGVAGRWLEAMGMPVMFRWTGAALAASVMALPLMVRAIRLSLESVDRRLEAAARTLGASRARVFATITLPLALPGVLAGMVLGLRAALVNLARRSPLCRTFRARRRPCRWRSIPHCKCRGRRGL
jgi:molybdate transport system permease protein